MGIKWGDIMKSFFGSGNNTAAVDEPVNITQVEAVEALSALDIVGCVEVSHEVAEHLGAFDERAISLDDVIDDAG